MIRRTLIPYGGLYRSFPEFAAEDSIWHGFGTRALGPDILENQARRRGLRIASLMQEHSDAVHRLSGFPRAPLKGDAFVTEIPGILLVIKTADCLPVLISGSGGDVLAAVHCGWRGTHRRIVSKVVGILEDEYGCPSSDLQAALGPCIAPECYEVGEDVRSVFAGGCHPPDLFRPLHGAPGKYHFDLRTANLFQLREAGLEDANIFSHRCCTHCEKHLYSYRREAHEAGRLLNFIGRCP